MNSYKAAMFVIRVSERNKVLLCIQRPDGRDEVWEFEPADARTVGANLMQCAVESEEEATYVERQRQYTKKLMNRPPAGNGGSKPTEGEGGEHGG